jgi:tight adherence protein C
MVAFMVAAAVLAIGLVRLVTLVVPPRTDLVAGVGRWDHARDRANRGPVVPRQGSSFLYKTATWLAEQAIVRGRDLTQLHQDLAISGSTLEQHLSKTLALSGVGLVGPLAIFSVLAAAGFAVPLGFSVLAGLGLAGAMLVVSHRELRLQADTRRAELRRAMSIYLDLVAMSMEAGRGYTEALPASAAIGSGWTFTHLQDAISNARPSGITAWAAIGELGERFGMPELVDFDGTLTLASNDGAKIKSSLVSRAQTLRARRVADAEAEANKATESMNFTLIVMVFAFLFYELYPSVARLFAG